MYIIMHKNFKIMWNSYFLELVSLRSLGGLNNNKNNNNKKK